MPNPPTGLVVTALNSHMLNVDWTNGASSSPALMFTQVWYGTSSSFSAASFFVGSAPGNTSVVIPGLQPGTAYNVWLVAQDTGNNVSSGSVSASTTTLATVNSVTPVIPSLSQDLLNYIVQNLSGYSAGTRSGNFALFAEPLQPSPSEGGFISESQELSPHGTNPFYESVLSILFRSPTSQQRVLDNAEGIRQFLHQKVDPVGITLPSGRFVLAARFINKAGMPQDSSGNFQVQLNINLQLQGNDSQLSPVVPIQAISIPVPALVSGSVYTQYGNTNNLTFSYTGGSGANTLLVARLVADSSTSISSFTYGGQALTRALQSAGGNSDDIETWYLVNPPAGSNTLTVNWGSGNYHNYGIAVMTYSGVNQSNPIGTKVNAGPTGSVSNYTSSITTTAANSLISDYLSIGSGLPTFTLGVGQVMEYSVSNSNPSPMYGDHLAAGAAGAYNLTYTSFSYSQPVSSQTIEIIA